MIITEVRVFLWSILVGAVLALLFDIFRLFRRRKSINKLMVCLQDIVYLILVLLMIVISAFICNNGEIRGYMILAYVVGIIGYLLVFSRLFLKIAGYIIDVVVKITCKVRDTLVMIPKKILKK